MIVLLAVSSSHFTEDPGSWSLFWSEMKETPQVVDKEMLLFLLLVARVFEAVVVGNSVPTSSESTGLRG